MDLLNKLSNWAKQLKNRAINYDKQNTIKLNKVKEIYKDSNGLDNISAHMMNQFNQIMRGSA